jgi:predicted N-acetyltransferase YhbS
MAYRAIPLRLEVHAAALARLWAENMSDGTIAAAIPARMRWLYEQAPDGPAVTVLALDEGGGEVVGCGSFLPRTARIDGRPCRAAMLCDFAVARPHRLGGAAIAIQRALVEAGRAAGVELLYGFPNEKSAAVFRRVGYRVVGESSTWVKPLRSAWALRRRLGPAAGPLSVPLDAGLRALDAVLARTRSRVTARALSGADAGAAGIAGAPGAARGITLEKSAAWLDWRYRGVATGPRSLLGVWRRGEDRLSGVAAYRIDGRQATVDDLLADGGTGGTDALLLALAATARAQGADALTVTYVGPAGFGDGLRRLGFLRRAGRRPLVVHAGLSPEAIRERACDASSWFLLDGELDI